MVFSSPIFLFLFLPATLLVYFLAAKSHRNVVLLLASLGFYYWGEAGFVLLMIASVVVNYVFGLLLSSVSDARSKRWLVLFAVLINLLPLCFFKYTVFVLAAVRDLTGSSAFADLSASEIHLPIGISFFTFQAISYVIDVYRSDARAQKNPINLALYISLFPQLIAGPIVRYNEVSAQIESRTTRLDDLREGVARFIVGLGKKVLIANVVGQIADEIFGLPAESLSPGIAFLGIVAYSLQIYYDFSGYSDMAIGLGRIFGFRFPENFNYPYRSQSVTEFWRRWHMSLSRWFRDYLYIPLGGNRHGAWRTWFNLMIVFVLCGLWHGAAWTFLAWGLFHGAFLVLERAGFSELLSRLPAVLRHVYTLGVVMLAWVFFRANDISHAFEYLVALFDFSRPLVFDPTLLSQLTLNFWITAAVGVVFSFPVWQRAALLWKNENGASTLVSRYSLWQESVTVVALACVAVYSVAAISGSDYNPFLYFRF